MPDRLEVATEAAVAAGVLLSEHFARGVTVERKGRIDLVSVADRSAEALIVERLSAAFPGETIVGEEGEAVPEEAVAGRPRWYVDPLDGTTNFLRGRPQWGVSIAWCSPRDRVEVGVVHVPRAGETYRAVRGAGATLNGASLRVGEVTELHDALVASGFPYDFSGPTNLPEWAAVTVRALSMRSTGAAALELCQVAAGRLDAFWESVLERWDVAAGALVAAEAGALVTDLRGQPLIGPARQVLAANPALHGLLAEVLAEAAR